MTTTINVCRVVANSGSRADYDDKFLYSRSYSGSRADYDDKFLYSLSYSGSRADYDD